MSKRRRSSVKAHASRKRKTEQVSNRLVTQKVECTSETKDKEKDEGGEITPKIRIGPKIFLTGPNRSATGVEDTDRGAAPGIMHGKSDADHKSKDSSLSRKTDSKVNGRRRQNGREILDSVVISAANGWKDKCAMSETRIPIPIETLTERVGQMEEKLCEAKKRISELEVALNEKSKELDAATSFMNVIKPLSVADIIDLAISFNNEVFQGAAYIAESLGSSKHRHRGHNKRTAQYQGEYKQALMSLGTNLLRDLIQEQDHSSGFFLLQVALQVCMVTFGANVLQSWSQDDIEHKVTDQIYRQILSNETQGVAGSWRSVTRRSQSSRPTHREEKIDALLDTVIDIMKVAGCLEDDASAFLERFQGSISSVVDSVLQLRDAVGNITHMDILPMTVPPESSFSIEAMTNCYPSEAGATISESDKVLATTDLGLEHKINNLKGNTHGGVLLKPKVVLHSALLSLPESERESS